MPYSEIGPNDVDKARKTLSTEEPLAIRVHSVGCPACHSMEGAWNSVKRLAVKQPDVHVMNVDANAARELAEEHSAFNINGYPTMMDKSGKEHEGGRSAEELVKWAAAAGKRSHEMGGGKSRRKSRRRRTRRKTKRRGAGRRMGRRRKPKSRRTRRR